MRPKGYITSFGYFGFIASTWRLFATEQEYIECFLEWSKEVNT